MHGLQIILLLNVLICLKQAARGSDIIGGEKVPRKSMLYMVSVQNKSGHICGGFLITEDFVVTAAHCDNEYPTHVVLGNHNLNKGQKISIIKKFKPRFYLSVLLGDDIMLLKLSRKAQLSDIVKIIRLPTAKINLNENEVCKVAGWGITENGTLTNILRVVNVPVINKKVCKKQYSVINIRLPANVICAGGYPTHKGFCQGDSGGPLVCAGLAVGIVSFKKGKCNYPEAPNVYTDISKYLLWINAILKNPNSYL
ncbi:mast cell protease 2 isoform X1 [Haplochromis burtoni]|uniref:Mast cell protease 2-like n=1 Tax=Haplochromis burtoni TaxID=8153 RepID=A0A3Q2VBT8_HAPBU|nr:mast cell protease 2 isoform X1 [Haplochromis burtoni]